MSDLYDLNMRLLKTADEVSDSLEDLRVRAADYAEAERVYRKAKAIAFLRSSGRNKEEREANAEGVKFDRDTLNDIRYRRDLAEGLKLASLEAVRSRRAQLSAIQTLANLSREEASFARTGPA